MEIALLLSWKNIRRNTVERERVEDSQSGNGQRLTRRDRRDHALSALCHDDFQENWSSLEFSSARSYRPCSLSLVLSTLFASDSLWDCLPPSCRLSRSMSAALHLLIHIAKSSGRPPLDRSLAISQIVPPSLFLAFACNHGTRVSFIFTRLTSWKCSTLLIQSEKSLFSRCRLRQPVLRVWFASFLTVRFLRRRCPAERIS